MRLLLPAAAIVLACDIRSVDAQKPTRDDYIGHLPTPPSIVAQTDASRRLQLYGDRTTPTYTDRHPVDGIDDARARLLLSIAERFSPILRRNNNFQVPRHFLDLLAAPSWLHLDVWQGGRRIASDSVALKPEPPPVSGDGGHGSGVRASDDEKLRALVSALHPTRPRTRVVPAGGRADTILFVDIPGDDERSWRQSFERHTAPPRTFAHFFLEDAPTRDGAPRVHFEIQYWFYYPFNDSANNHEGDWEHITVCITTRARALEQGGDPATRGLPSAQDALRIMSSDDAFVLDSLVIREVDYYFHHNVMTLDYLAALGSEPEPARGQYVSIWQDRSFIRRVTRGRLAAAEGRLATHPIGYIGGNNLGPDELIRVLPRLHRSFNRNSDATYPFPGVWLTVGPLGMTEKVRGSAVPPIREDVGPSTSWRELIADESFITFGASEITLIPDWERLDSLVLTNAEARLRWSWMILPIRWGFPAVASPGAGSLKHTNLGNLGPFGPTYNNAWNRRGATDEYHRFDPTILYTPTSPTTPWSNLVSGWGILNLPLAIFGLTPGGNVAVTQLAPWLTGALHLANKPPSKTITPGRLPLRFTDASAGTYRQGQASRLARLLPHEEHPTLAPLLQNGRVLDERASAIDGPRFTFNLFFTNRVSAENSVSWGVSDVAYLIEALDGSDSVRVYGKVALREFTGGFRVVALSALGGRVRLSTRIGAGWMKYVVRQVRLDDAGLADAEFRGGRLPSVLPSKRWIPNAGYLGLGIELFAPRERYLLRRVGYGIRADLTGVQHRLDDRAPGTKHGPTHHHTDISLGLVFGW
ncbi:MAG: hypothetical protein ACT4PJ_13000 [Gemmatimonadaceae bacterium]